ncbi:MAG TPA: SUMF1/EgtB/PvdO family nonheme iron enzyme [Polyangiaceae bacterium]|nr:SUMF1/EgtB/PvdO family nonheme iron enzyme [Polyangiaceae bacterium]
MDRPGQVMRTCALALALAPSCKEAPPPLGEALVVVDTDAPVPALVGRLRVDFYTTAGEWFESRDLAAPDPSAWPLSFSVFTPDEVGPRDVIVRLRAYPEGKTRDYRGERFAPRGATEATPVDKRLVASGVDITPRSEPQPLLTIDRILRISLQPGRVGSARAVLRGACFGTMADLATGASCVDTENARVTPAASALDPDMSLPSVSLQGSFGAAEPCAGAPRAHEVCVPGGAFVFGNASEYGAGDGDGVPERIARVSAFYMDRHEYTVGRWRPLFDADPTGEPGQLVGNDGPIASTSKNELDRALCSASLSPRGREELALTCLTWPVARALCRLVGADLPTEVQWEYAAQVAGRAAKTVYPWGRDAVTCERAVHGRLTGGTLGRSLCTERGAGPAPVDTAGAPGGDVTSLGVVGLGGGVSELVRDAFFGYQSACWRSAGLLDPTCTPDAGPVRQVRGGNWASNAPSVASPRRQAVGIEEYAPTVGFRCVRPSDPGGP